jgi:hypothetical protein
MKKLNKLPKNSTKTRTKRSRTKRKRIILTHLEKKKTEKRNCWRRSTH